MGKYPKVFLNSIGPGIKDLARTDFRTLVGATQGGVNQHARITMRPTRQSLVDSMRILDDLEFPFGAKFDGGGAHRRAITPEGEHWPVSIMGPNGLFILIPSVLSESYLMGGTGSCWRSRLAVGRLNWSKI